MLQFPHFNKTIHKANQAPSLKNRKAPSFKEHVASGQKPQNPNPPLFLKTPLINIPTKPLKLSLLLALFTFPKIRDRDS